MFHVEAVIDAPLDEQEPVRLAQRALMLLNNCESWRVRLVKAQSRKGTFFLDATDAEVMHANAVIAELDGEDDPLAPVALILAKELKRVHELSCAQGYTEPHPRMMAIAEGIIASHELAEAAELGERGELTGEASAAARKHAADCHCNHCIGAMHSAFPSEPIKYAEDAIDAATGEGRR